MQDSEANSLIGQVLGEYRLQSVLGVGGMATVYRAWDLPLEREVAVKVLPASLADDAEYVRRFRDEAKRVAALNHPHIVPIYAFGAERGLLYHVMPVLHGSLRDRLLHEGQLPPDEAVRVVQQIASALGAAHALGLVHRDVKPGNILLDAEGNALLTDFGIARPLTELRQAGVARTLAKTGMPIGTPEYMAPEQLRGVSPLDQRVDIYALGAVLYELVTGAPPHEAVSPFEVAALALSAPIVPPAQRNPAVWPALDQVVLKALAREATDRYPDMHSFSAALAAAVYYRADHTTTAAAFPPLTMGTRVLAQLRGIWAKRAQRVAAIALAVALLGAAGSALVFLGKGATARGQTMGSQTAGGPTGSGTVTVGATSATATASPNAQPSPSVTPHRALTATATPVPHPSPTPAPTLLIRPTPLVLQPGTPTGTCVATQSLTNTTGQTVGWQWQQPQVGGFHFQVNGGPQMDWPKDLQPGIAPGGTDTLSATSNCQPQPKSYAILLTDTLGDQYTFVLQLQ
ncbi:MAG TPA: protein kinase [Ktedonobacterales bacterium]|nr:protein kinase [Ktedonobacterales bacterium]